MSYIIKQTYEKAGADVLLEHMLGVPDILNEIFADPRVLTIDWYRSDTREYGQCFIEWESKQSYDDWEAEYHDAHESSKTHMEEYMQNLGINFSRLYPDENQDWTDPIYSDPRITLDHHVTYDQIFE